MSGILDLFVQNIQVSQLNNNLNINKLHKIGNFLNAGLITGAWRKG